MFSSAISSTEAKPTPQATARDRLMIDLDGVYPGYGFASHKGYNAPVPQDALKRLGPCPAHRRAWAPIKALLEDA